MTAHQLAHLLLAGPDVEVVTCPTAEPVDAVEQCPGDFLADLGPYCVVHNSRCRETI